MDASAYSTASSSVIAPPVAQPRRTRSHRDGCASSSSSARHLGSAVREPRSVRIAAPPSTALRARSAASATCPATPRALAQRRIVSRRAGPASSREWVEPQGTSLDATAGTRACAPSTAQLTATTAPARRDRSGWFSRASDEGYASPTSSPSSARPRPSPRAAHRRPIAGISSMAARLPRCDRDERLGSPHAAL